jgi:hypothetical protein
MFRKKFGLKKVSDRRGGAAAGIWVTRWFLDGRDEPFIHVLEETRTHEKEERR